MASFYLFSLVAAAAAAELRFVLFAFTSAAILLDSLTLRYLTLHHNSTITFAQHVRLGR